MNEEALLAPKQYICTIKEDGLQCMEIQSTDEDLIEYCARNRRTKVLVRYPRGQRHDDAFMAKFRKHANVLFSERFDITKAELKKLLYKLYYHSSRMRTEGAIQDKFNKVWDNASSSNSFNNNVRKIDIYIFELYDDCDCVRKVDRGRNYGENEEWEHQKRMKKDVRSLFGTMHALHTSDNHEETMFFVRHIFTASFPK